MKRKVQKMAAVLLVFVFVLSMTGCGEKFDATGFVKAELDLLTKHDVDQYVETTGVKKDEAEKIYTEAIESMDISTELLGEEVLPEEIYTAYEEWFLNVLAKTKYTVLNVKESDGEYIVTVEIEPLKAFEGMEEKVTAATTAYMEEVYQTVLEGGAAPSEEQMNIHMYNLMLDVFNEILETATYSEKVSVDTRIIKNSNGTYEIDEATFEEVGAKLIDISELQ